MSVNTTTGRLVRTCAGLAVCCLMAGNSWAQADLPVETASGFRFAGNTLILQTAASPRELAVATELDAHEKTLADEADRIMRAGATRALVVSRKGRILLEKYAAFVSEKSTPHAFSISKSLVAVTVGKALCDGSIKSLDDKAEVYVPQLKGSSYGDATVRQLLMMASGAYVGDMNTGHPVGGNESAALSNMYLRRGLDVRLLERLPRYSGHAAPGAGFSYKNYDTQSLVYVVEAATGTDFGSYFEKNVWLPSGPERAGAWLRDADKKVIGFAGFSAAPRDYVRFGYFLIDEMKKEGDCMAGYLKTATAGLSTIAAGRTYGYQIHKVSTGLVPESFWFLGFGGQLLGVDPRSETVVYAYQGNSSQAWPLMRASLTMMGQLQ